MHQAITAKSKQTIKAASNTTSGDLRTEPTDRRIRRGIKWAAAASSVLHPEPEDLKGRHLAIRKPDSIVFNTRGEARMTLAIALIVVCGLIGTLIGAAIDQAMKARRKAAKPQAAEAKTGRLPTAAELNSWPGLAVGLNEVLEERGYKEPLLKELDDLDKRKDER
jgi:hypothetical protein